MGIVVTGGANLQCSFGATPSAFMVTPQNRVIKDLPVGNIMDNKPMINIMSFGVCSSPANPVVAAATAAAFGVLTPMPCVPVTTAPWIPGVPPVLVGNMPVLNNTCKLMCAYAGVIQVLTPGQFNVMA